MHESKVTKTRAFGITNSATVFQAELHAIRMATSLIKENIPEKSKVVIMCDSQAAILALENIDTRSKLVNITKDSLNTLCTTHDIRIQWIKAHVNNLGNEIADRAAKTGCTLENKATIPVSMAYVKDLIKKNMWAEWDRRWQTAPDCRQTFQFYPCFDEGKSKIISKLNRNDLGIMIRYLTGHAHLRRHNKIADTKQPRHMDFPMMEYHLADPDDQLSDPEDWEVICRLCKLKNTEETPYHLATSCLGAWSTRMRLLGSYSFEGEDIFRWKPTSLLQFFKHFDLENKPNSL